MIDLFSINEKMDEIQSIITERLDKLLPRAVKSFVVRIEEPFGGEGNIGVTEIANFQFMVTTHMKIETDILNTQQIISVVELNDPEYLSNVIRGFCLTTYHLIENQNFGTEVNR